MLHSGACPTLHKGEGRGWRIVYFIFFILFPGPPSGIDLLKAAESGDTARVTALLGRGVAVDSRNDVSSCS